METTRNDRPSRRRLRQHSSDETRPREVISIDSSSDEFVLSSGNGTSDSEEEISQKKQPQAQRQPLNPQKRGFKRLRKTSDISPAPTEPVADSQADDDASEWECVKCTYINQPLLLACELCLSVRKTKRQSTRKIGSWLAAAAASKPVASKQRPSKPPVAVPVETIDSSDEGEQKSAPVPSREKVKMTTGEVDSALWSEASSAQSIDDLCVQKKKVQEVQEWLLAATTRPSSRLLFVCGPPGSGKSTTVRHLAERMGFAVKEWRDNSAAGRLQYNRLLRDDYQVTQHSAWDDFADFISLSMNYKSLVVESTSKRHSNSKQASAGGQLVLLESWPQNPLGSQDSQWDEKLKQAFRQIVHPASNLQYPVVCIFSDVRDKKMDMHQLAKIFSDEVMRSPYTSVINFNPVTTAQVKKTLMRTLEKQGVPLAAVELAKIVDQSNGDIRHAINMAQMALKRQSSRLKISKQISKPVASAPNRAAAVDDEPEEIRDEFLSDFHIVGKLLHSKSADASGATIDYHERVVDSSGMALDRVLSLLHSNCPQYFIDIDDLAHAIDLMSLSEDWLHASYKAASGATAFKTAHNIAQAVIIRTVRLSNDHPAPSAFRPIVAARGYETTRRMEAFRRDALREQQQHRDPSTPFTDYVCRGDVYAFEVQPLADCIGRPSHHRPVSSHSSDVLAVVEDDDIENSDGDGW